MLFYSIHELLVNHFYHLKYCTCTNSSSTLLVPYLEYQQNITVITHKDIQCESNAKIKTILQNKKQKPLHKKDAAFFTSTRLQSEVLHKASTSRMGPEQSQPIHLAL